MGQGINYYDARLPGLKKLVGEWYPADASADHVQNRSYGSLIIPRKQMKNLALPAFSGEDYMVGHVIRDGQIFLITVGTTELFFMQVASFSHLSINRSGDFVFTDVVGIEPDNLDVLNAIHLAKQLNRR